MGIEIKKISKSKRNVNGTPVLSEKDGIIIQYKSLREAERQTGVPHSNISTAIKSGKKRGGYY